MSQPYSQARALWAITRASFKAIFNQPTAIVFSLLFPIIFILIFGAFGEGGGSTFRITFSRDSDTTNALYNQFTKDPALRIVRYADTVALNKDLVRGRLTAVVRLKEIKQPGQQSRYTIQARSTSASSNTLDPFLGRLDYMKLKYESVVNADRQQLIEIEKADVAVVRPYKQIDFILPGQLGFSILFSTLFGIAFTFFTLREQLILKRFYASPVSRINILLGIGVSRLFFQLMNVVVLIGFGHFFLDFTLQHGFITFIELIFGAVYMLFLLMGVGLIFSSIVKSDASIPLLINLFGFPQMLLSGTFFPVEVFPRWLQEICQFLPLTQFNNAMRKISFEGLHLYDCWKELGILSVWIILIYFIASKTIKWE